MSTKDKKEVFFMEILGVTKTIVKHLRMKIITGDLSANTRLNEIDLSRELGISRAPLREGFRVLEEEQLAYGIPRKGCYVAGVSIEDFRELYQIREMIEIFSIELLEEKGQKELPEAELAFSLTASLPMPGPDADSQERLDYLLAFANFHHAIVGSAGNKQLMHIYTRIGFHLARYQYMYAYYPGLTRNSQRDHMRLLNYIKKRQYSEAKNFLKSHIKRFVDLIGPKIEAGQTVHDLGIKREAM
jgi:DNA-binding GntR family transcriptional regulator